MYFKVKFRSEVDAKDLFDKVPVIPPSTLKLPDAVPYCSLLMTHASGGEFQAHSLSERKASCIAIGIQGFNRESLGQDVANLLEDIVAPDMSYFGRYDADIIKLAYSHMHPLTHWNVTPDLTHEMDVDPPSSVSDKEDPKDGVWTPK